MSFGWTHLFRKSHQFCDWVYLLIHHKVHYYALALNTSSHLLLSSPNGVSPSHLLRQQV